MNPSKIVFVTGGSGFIGSNLVEQLLASGYTVRGLSRRPPVFPPGFEKERRLLWEHPNFTYVAGDITDPQSLFDGIAGSDFVIHLAGYAKNYSPDPKVYEKINVVGMRNLFAASREHNVKKIVWTSSFMTLGPTKKGQIGDETMPRNTASFLTEYEKSKTVAEREAFRWIQDGLPLVIVNPTRVYGPGQLSEGNALAGLIDDYLRGRFPILINRGVNVGNYVLVDDVARGHLLAMEKGTIGTRYILGGENASLRDFFRTIDRVTGTHHWQIPIFWFWPMVVAHAMQLRAKMTGAYPRITPGWVRTFLVDWAFDSSLAKNELGYNPTSLEEGLRRTCRWLGDQRK